MRLLVRWFLLLAWCRWAAVDASGQSKLPDTVEVDLVFPHNDTYAPAPIIPIVFAVQNFHVSQPLHLYSYYTITGVPWWNTTTIQEGMIHFDTNHANYSNNAGDLHFVYEYTSRLHNTQGSWTFIWELYAGNCTDTGRGPAPLQGSLVYTRKEVYFSTSEGAQQPHLVAATTDDSCEKTQGVTFNITQVLDVPDSETHAFGQGVCPVVSWLSPTPRPCSVRIDAAAASNMSYQIQSWACMDGLNPNVTCPSGVHGESVAIQLAPFTSGQASCLVGLGHLLPTNFEIVSAQATLRHPVSPSYAGRNACPERCIISGPNPANWSAYHNFDQFQSCQETLFYGFSIHDVVDDANTLHRIYSCTSYGSDWANIPNSSVTSPVESAHNATYEIGWSIGKFTGQSTATGGALIVLTRQLRQYLAGGNGHRNKTTLLFAQFGQTAVGLYIGKGLQSEGIGSFALKALEDTLLSSNLSASSITMQACEPGRDHIFGIMATGNGTFTPIQNTMKSWAKADCISLDESSSFTGPAYFITPLVRATNGTVPGNRGSNSTSDLKSRISRVSDRDDSRPKPNADGSCHVYTVHGSDNCWSIATANGITIDELDSFNKNTWGWNGCTNVWDKINICLSTGTPPMPNPMANAVCGPQVPGTQAPAAGTDISKLNPCPLHACCDVWGQCGTTQEFCVDTSTGTPGTAKPGTNGCISNCGTSIVRGDPPAVFRKIGYFEGYSFSSRECLYQDALQIDGSQYTHVHFGFGMITQDYQINTGNAETTYEFENFKRISGAKRILSFGGWDFSTSPDTYTIFREGVKPANRLTLATNIANFIKKHNLDGVDIDWEYPSAPDIPNIPPAPKEEGMDYFYFLVILKNLLAGKSLSIAAPASYWYLKGYPIQIISLIVDYIVFMTYDLHGQWDSQNQWSQVGCPSGMCLRSGVNLTETINSLVMITKAGVPSNKIVVGVTSYGRSFGMAQADCYGPDCFYTGGPLNSGAKKGRCTNTAGYIADAEIKEILKDSSRVNQNYLDGPSNSNILVYDDTQWVSYMSPEVLSTRTQIYKSLNMGGTTNWAIDLEDYNDVPNESGTSNWVTFKEDLNSGLDPYQKGDRHGNWTSLTCTDRYVEDNDDFTPSERWSGLDCPDAWKDVIDIWKTSYQGKSDKPFSTAVVNILHGPQTVRCETVVSQNHCDEPKECTDFVGSGTGPAGYEIFNSFVEIHGEPTSLFSLVDSLVTAVRLLTRRFKIGLLQMYDDFRQAVTEEAALYINNALPNFENKFAPVPEPEDNRWLLLLIDLITLGAGLAAGPFFNSYLSKLPYFIKNDAAGATLKDTTMTLIGQSTTIAKDMLSTNNADSWSPKKQAEFSHYMGQALDAWANLAEASVHNLFNGSDTSIGLLTSLISDGKFIQGKGRGAPASPSNAALKAAIGKAFFAYAIPAIWAVSGTSPFIIDSGFNCGVNDPIGGYMASDTMHRTWHCVDDKLYYLASPKGDAKSCVKPCTGCADECKDNKFSAPPGIEWLDGSSFGQITLSDLVTGSVRTYKANGGQNTNTSPDPNTLASFTGVDVTAPGFIRMPVCSPAMAYKAWIGNGDGPDTSAPGYPCAVPKNDDFCGASTFVDQTSGASPPVSDCLALIKKIQDRSDPTDHEIENAVGNQHQIEEYGECKFGVQGNGKNGNIDFHVGGQDIIDLINDSINKFGSSGRVGAKGSMSCKGTVKGQDVDWGLY
ncbi:chitinase [Pochonia chlamydosporia 170]|uniref:chitinase n=1 Tax=Pochonia chlamydosporia 170 TaxID=1380566 RepID=A0A179FED5_METCM|nr:chitinase [Pochonia chlamydosporia 170]OAQ63718.2 chitinase [Pochonia chlamydosporia 170]